MDNFRKGFPVLEQYTYLNTAGSGLLPEKVWEFRQDHDMNFLIKGGLFKENMGKLLTEVRESIGSLFFCEPHRIALIPNFSYGMNSILESLDKPQKVLLLQGDYPSVNWPVEARNFETVYARMDEYLEENIQKQMEVEKPDVFAFSMVQYISGLKLDTDYLKILKLKYPEVIFIADGTQYFGTEKFDFDDSGIDIALASCYKWMNAGYGNGFILFNEAVQEKLNPKHIGYGSLQGKYKEHEGNFLGRFEPGHYDTLNFGSLKVAIDLINHIGIDKISTRITHLREIAQKRFANAGLINNWLLARRSNSSIFNIRGDESLFQRLRGEEIITSLRGEGIRISIHYFNNEEDLDHLFNVLGI